MPGRADEDEKDGKVVKTIIIVLAIIEAVVIITAVLFKVYA